MTCTEERNGEAGLLSVNEPGDVVINDPRAMRALAHPARLAILGRLQAEGPATATECAEVTGQSPSACSYHLRLLAKYGFVADAPSRGDQRERVWRSLGRTFTWGADRDQSREQLAAGRVLAQTMLHDAVAEIDRWWEHYQDETEEWRHAAGVQKAVLRVTAEELDDLVERLTDLVMPFTARVRGAQDAPEAARLVQMLLTATPRSARPRDGHGAEDT